MTNAFFLQGCGLCNSHFKLRVPDFNCRLCGSYFKPRVPDLIAGCVAPISNHVYPTFQVPTLARHNNTSLPPLGSSRDSIYYSSLPVKWDLLPTSQLIGVLVQSFGASGFSRWKSSMYSDA